MKEGTEVMRKEDTAVEEAEAGVKRVLVAVDDTGGSGRAVS